MRTPLLLCLLLIVSVLSAQSQNVTITPNGITPASSHPRLTYDAILALPNPAEGDLAYDLTFKCLRVFTDNKWVCTLTNNSTLNPIITTIDAPGSTENDYGFGVAVDAGGNVYVTGAYAGTVAFGNTSITSVGSQDIFIAKYNGAGALQWVRSAGGPNGDQGLSIAVNASGNVYITGLYSATATFGNTSVTAAGANDIFVAKYDNNGNFQWVRSAGGTDEDNGRGIAVDAAGNAYITGHFRSTATFGGSPVTSAGGEDIVIAKYDNDGTFQWVYSTGSSSDDRGMGITTDAAGNMFVTGYYLETINLGGTSLTSSGGYDIFLAKYNSGGVVQWAKTLGGLGHEYGQSVAVSPNGNIAVAGGFQGPTSFSGTTINSEGIRDMFVLKCNSAGGFLWAKTGGGTGYDHGYSVFVDANDQTYVTGCFETTGKFGTVSKVAAGSQDIFVAKYSSGGTLQWVVSAGGTGSDIAMGVAIDSNINIYFTGGYSATAIFGNRTHTSAGSSDIFVGRLDK
ncbi:SBBP repeat-containing protein [Runella sp.]|uniref:SBBP repeat-containing protein n=1 Tax=Runella sp. TaxID=1960881 RepID=UPI003D151673